MQHSTIFMQVRTNKLECAIKSPKEDDCFVAAAAATIHLYLSAFILQSSTQLEISVQSFTKTR